MQLLNYKNYLELVLKSAGLCVFEVDLEKQTYLGFVNAEAIYGVSGEKILQDVRSFAALDPELYMEKVSNYFVHPTDAGVVADAFEKVLSGEQAIYDARMRTAPGDYMWCRVHATTYQKEDGSVNMIGVVSNVSNLYEHILDAREKSMRDLFTGLYNKTSFDILCRECLCSQPKPCYALAIIDLDDFKNINDTFGHAAGDRVLLDVSKQLQKHFLQQTLIGRFGGDEFILLIPFSKLCYLEKTFNDFLQDSVGSYPVTKSIGYVVVPDGLCKYETLLEQADQALYVAKKTKDCIQRYEQI